MLTGNNEFQRQANMVLVAECILCNKEISRAGISKELGLFRSTVSNLVSQLLDLGVIEERSFSSSTEKGGRKGVLLGIRGSAGLIAGVELDDYGFNYVLLDIAGQKRDGGVITGFDTRSFEDHIDQTVRIIREKASALKIPLIGMSLGFSGVIDSKKGIVIRSGKFKLKDFDFSGKVASRYDFPVLIDNDARACTWGELWENWEVETFCYLYYRLNLCKNTAKEICHGYSFGVVVNRHVHSGANNISGELFQGHREKINNRYQKMFEDILNGEGVTAEKIKKDYPDVVYDLKNMISFIDPNRVIIGDKLKDKISLFDTILNRDIDATDPFYSGLYGEIHYPKTSNSSVVCTSLGEYEVARGAACLFLMKLYSVPQIGRTVEYPKIGWEELFSPPA